MNLRLTSFQKLALTTIVAVYVMIVIGVIVRSTGSGLGCGDWPLCRGAIIPALDGPNAWDRADWIESIHRWWGVIVGFLVLGLAIQAWRVQRAVRSIPIAAIVAVLLTGFQAWLGKWTVESGNSDESVTAHLAVSMLILAATVFVFVRSRYPAQLPPHGASQRLTVIVAFAAASVYVLMLFGSNVTVNAASLVFPDWPLFDGQLIPTWHEDSAAALLQMHHFAHRIVAAIVGVIMLATTYVTWRAAREAADDEGRAAAANRVFGLVGTAAALYAVQVVVGAFQIWTTLAAWAVSTHLALGAAIWGLMAAAALFAWYDARSAELPAAAEEPIDAVHAAAAPQGPTAAPGSHAVSRRATIKAYVALTKPRIIELLLVTTVPAMVLAWRFTEGLGAAEFTWLVVATLIGGTLAAGAANAINNYLDRDIDLLMVRTQRRPLPAHSIAPQDALLFGLVLTVISFAWLALTTNLVAAFLSLLGHRLLRHRLHAAVEACHAAEHRHRRSRRRAAADDRLGRGHRRHLATGGLPLRHRLLLDAAALLGPGAAHPRRLRGRVGADAAGDPRRAPHDPPDRALHRAHGGADADLLRGRGDGSDLPRRRAGAGRHVPVPGLRHGAGRHRRPRRTRLQVLDHLPDRALRADHPRRRLLHPAGLGARPMGATRALTIAAVMLVVVALVAACEPTLKQATGIVVSVDSPALGQVDAFELLTQEGETLTFDTSELRFRSEFPASHLFEHQVIGDDIVVTYKHDGARLVVTQLDDRNH